MSEPTVEEIIDRLRDEPLEFSKLSIEQQVQLLEVICPRDESLVFIPESYPKSRFRYLKYPNDQDQEFVNSEQGWLLSLLEDRIYREDFQRVIQLMKFFRVEVADTYAWIDPDAEYPPCYQVFPFGCFSNYPGPIKRAPNWLCGIYQKRYHHAFFHLDQLEFDLSLACNWRAELTVLEFVRDFQFVELKPHVIPRVQAMMSKLNQVAFVPDIKTGNEPYLFLIQPSNRKNVALAVSSCISRPIWCPQNFRSWDRQLQQGIKTTLLMIYCRQKEFPIHKDLRFILLQHLFDAHFRMLELYEQCLLANFDRYSSLTQRVSVCLQAGIVIPNDKHDFETRQYIAALTRLELGILPESARRHYRETLSEYLQKLPGTEKVCGDLCRTLGISNGRYILDYCEEFEIDYTLLVNEYIGMSLVPQKFFSYLYRRSLKSESESDESI